MLGYILKRFTLAVPTLLGVTFITFLLVTGIPGDPAYTMVGQRASARSIEQNRRMMGVDRPFIVQYGKYLENLSFIRLPSKSHESVFKVPYLGESYFTHRPVVDLIAEKFPNTFRLALAAVLLALVTGIGLGVLSAAFPGRLPDRLASFLAIGGISIPVFWTGLILILVFSCLLGWLPASGTGGGSLIFLILPALTLGSRSCAYLARITRASMLEISSRPFITTARAKGLGRCLVLFRHIFRNALIPIVTLAAVDFGSYLNGSVLTETIFGWDGLGRLVMNSIRQQDYPVLLGCVLLGAVVFVLVNIAVDISYAWIDPRIRKGSREV